MEDGGPTWRHYLLEPCTSEVELELGSSLADKQTRRGAGSMYLDVVHPSYCLSPLVLFASPETDERPLERLTDSLPQIEAAIGSCSLLLLLLGMSHHTQMLQRVWVAIFRRIPGQFINYFKSPFLVQSNSLGRALQIRW